MHTREFNTLRRLTHPPRRDWGLHPSLAGDGISADRLHGSLGSHRRSAAGTISRATCAPFRPPGSICCSSETASLRRSLVAVLKSFDSIVSWYGENRRGVSGSGAGDESKLDLSQGAAAGRVRRCMRQTSLPRRSAHRSVCHRAIPVAPLVAAWRIVLHPFSGSRKKNWPLERFQELAARLGRTCDSGWPGRRTFCRTPSGSPTWANWRAGWRERACTSATIPASPIWQRRWAHRRWHCSDQPTPTCGDRAASGFAAYATNRLRSYRLRELRKRCGS